MTDLRFGMVMTADLTGRRPRVGLMAKTKPADGPFSHGLTAQGQANLAIMISGNPDPIMCRDNRC